MSSRDDDEKLAVAVADERDETSEHDEADNDGDEYDHNDDGDDFDHDDDDDSHSDEEKYAGMTKTEIKAMRARAYWKKKRVMRRDKHREKKRRAISNGEPVPQTRARMVRWLGEDVEAVWARDFVLPHVCIDGKFTSQLTDKERRSLRSQIGHMYGHMRRVERPCHLWIASLEDSMRQLLYQIDNANTWPIHYRTESVLELFPPDKHRIVYLSPDATDLLEDVTADTVYVIGGIVDRNRLKNCTVTEARTLGLQSARLPIFETLQCKMNNSLNVNHMYEILQTQSVTHDWRQTFERCLPKRVFQQNGSVATAAATTTTTTTPTVDTNVSTDVQ